MPQYVQAFGHTIEFPDGMSQDDITAALKQNALSVPKADPAPRTLTGLVTGKDAPRGFADQVSDAGSAVLHHAMNGFHGLAQLAENGVASAADQLPANPVSRYIRSVADQDNAAMVQREKDYQASTPDSAGAYTGATVGELLPFTKVAKGLQLAGDAVAQGATKVLPKVLAPSISGATQGAAASAAAPVTDDSQPYWQSKTSQVGGGGGIGAVLPPAIKLAAAPLKAAYNAISPILMPQNVVAPALQKWIGTDTAALRNAQEFVPGSKPTTAQVVANPDIVAAEKTLSNNPAFKGQFAERGIQNNAARLSQLESLAGTPKQLEDAVKARAAAAAAWTDPVSGKLAAGAPVDAGPIIKQLTALKASPLGVRPTIGGAADDMIATIKSRAQIDPNTGAMTVSPGILDAVRQNVKDYLAKHAPNGVVGTQQGAAFEPVRNSIVDAVEGANPGYRDYLANYAKNSAPINTMEGVRSILDNVGNRGANASGAPQLSLNGFNAQLKKTLDRQYGVSPNAEAALNGIQSDLQRETISNSIRQPGSDTTYNLQAPGWLAGQLYGKEFGGSSGLANVAGGLLGLSTGGPMGAVGGYTASKALASLGAKRVNGLLSDAMLDPLKAADLIESAKKSGDPRLKYLIPQLGLLEASEQASKR